MENKKQCPYCGEEIMAAAKKCRHCGEWLNAFAGKRHAVRKRGIIIEIEKR